MNFDKDLLSIQQARDLAAKAKEAQQEFRQFNQQQVDKVIKAMSDAGMQNSERLAKMACEESGFGKWQDKKIKNEFASRKVYESIKDLKTVGVIATENDGKIVKIAEPMGVVAALVPSTNPTSTAIFKSLISLKCRNAIVCSPHPRTVNCTNETLSILSEAAVKAGAPEGLILGMTSPTLEGTEALMKNKNVSIILATGSSQMVRAAYSSGKPAYGVGPGNVPAFIERTANYKKAVMDIVRGTTFDYGTLCSSEQAIVADRPLKEKIIEEAKKLGCYFADQEEKEKLRKIVSAGGGINPEIVGKPAAWIARHAGMNVPESTTVLVAELETVGRNEPLSMEKLSPILAFYTVNDWLEGCHRCVELLNFGGLGHSMVIHSSDSEIIMKFALEKPAFRILVNTVNSLGAVGYTTALSPSLTLGCGTWGGSSISENVTAKHLMNVKTLAFEVNPINNLPSLSSLTYQPTGFMQQIEERLKARAGNPPSVLNKTEGEKLSKTKSEKLSKTEGEKRASAPAAAASDSFGASLSKDEIDRIIREFGG